MRILLTNDDGIQAIGLRALFKALVDAGHDVDVVAPISEQSAVGHAVTLSSPLQVKEFKENGFRGKGVSGTPVDCVKLALSTLLDEKPDVVVSGINSGANVGIDILYSGTVSAATEAAIMGYSALAVSMDNYNPTDLRGQAAYAVKLLGKIEWDKIPERRVMNLNFPDCPIEGVRGLKVCPHTRACYTDWYQIGKDPRGRPYYWLDGEIPDKNISVGRDRKLLSEKYVTLTPLMFDFNDVKCLEQLSELTDI
ncbi:MAG: 5'/3'-nucleotidase SurE [Desulfovibrio sp.]